MPPRKAPARRNKSSATKPPTPAAALDHQSPQVVTETDQLPDDMKPTETTAHEESIREPLSDPNCAGTEVVVVSSESMAKEEEVGLADRSVGDANEARDEDGESEEEDPQEDEEEEEEDVDEEKKGEDLVKDAEIISAQEETTAAQVDDLKILDDKNNDVQDSENDGLVVNNGDVKGTTEMVSVQESAEAVITQTSCENNIALDLEDDSMENMDDDDESVDYSEGDDAGDEGGEDQDPSLIVQDSSLDNKKEKGTELYVGKLDKNVVEDDLVSVFQQFGELTSTRIVRKPNSNKSKGFGFVRFASVDQAKRALSELKDGVEVRGKRVVISASQDNDTLYLGNICKTWRQEQVSQQLKEYGIEHIEVLRVPEDPKNEKGKGFAFLEFSTHSDAVAAFQRLKKPDVFFGRDVSAKVGFAQTPLHSRDEDLSQVNEVHLEGLTKDWNEEKVKDICKNYGEVLKINLCPGKRGKRRDFGFVVFDSPESARACVEGINNTAAIEGEAKIKASIAKSQKKVRIQKQGIRGGFKAEKQSEDSNKKSQPKSSKINKTNPSKNKIKDNAVKPQQKGPHTKNGESSRGDNDAQRRNRKRKAFSEQKPSARDLGTPKKPKNGGQGQNSQSVSKSGSHKRKNPSGNEARDDRGNRNAQGKKPFKKQRGNVRGRERDNDRRPRSDTHTRRGPNPSRYAPKYAASASNAYHVASDHSFSTLRYKEMEPHAGYIEPAYAKPSGSYSGYVAPAVRTPHAQHQTVYLEPSSSQSQVYTRYVDRPVVTQPYRDYRSPANVQVARDHYDPGHGRYGRHDGRGAGVVPYVGGPPYQASQAPNHTGYYQAGGSYSGAYGSRGAYY